MLNIIVGNNASGKTVILEKKVRDCKGSYLYNLSKVDRMSLFNVEERKVEVVENVCPEYDLSIKENVLCNSGELTSNQFMGILNYLCRDTEFVFLDEPEFLLSIKERRNLYKILESLSVICEIWITTHDEYIREGSLWNSVKRYYPVRSSGEFVLHEMSRKDVYEDII